MSNAIVLQSGFIARSSTLDKLVRNNSEMANNFIIMIVKLGGVFWKEQTDFYYNLSVDELFYTLEKQPAKIKNFEIRELIIKTVSDCFGKDKENTIEDWLALQMHAPLMTDNHLAFLEKFIGLWHFEPCDFNPTMAGVDVQISLSTYERLVIPAEKENKLVLDRLKQYPRVGEYFRNRGRYSAPIDNNLILQRILSRDNGFLDLLYAVKIIFGNPRQVRLTSANKPYF
jgi:hypothetical protein